MAKHIFQDFILKLRLPTVIESTKTNPNSAQLYFKKALEKQLQQKQSAAHE